MPEIIYIEIDVYDRLYAEWVKRIYGKAMDDITLLRKFDASIGLHLTEEAEEFYPDKYPFIIVDKRKLLVAKLKYGF